MILILYLCLFYLCFHNSHFLRWQNELHQLCLLLAPQSKFTELYQASICGQNLNSISYNNLYLSTGLLHLIVVSGAHLIFLHKILLALKLNKNICLLFLCIYCALNRFEPPIFRAFIFLLCLDYFNRKNLRIGPLWVFFLSYLLCLCFQSQWLHSLSFTLSCLSSLILLVFNKSQLKHILLRQLGIQCISALFFSMGASQFFLFFVCNLIFSPIFSIILFPLSLLAFLIPKLQFASDRLWLYFHYSLEYIIGIHQAFTYNSDFKQWPTYFYTLLILCLWSFFRCLTIFYYRNF